MPRLIPITAQQAQSYQMGQAAPQAALQQPGAQLGLTQQETATSGQSQQTGAAEQQNIQAGIPGQVAESGIKQVQQQQVNYPLNLKADLSKGMTLKSALSQYSSLMKPDDIFRQYLAQSPHGIPHETPTELQNMGISGNALGKIGDPSSFMDRWNMRNAIQELRGLHDTWNQTSDLSHLPFLGDFQSSSRSYNAQKQVVGEHLSSLVPGASQSQGSNQGFLNSLPDTSDMAAPGSAEGQFNNIEKALLQSKGYSYEELGLSSPAKTPAPKKQSSGGDVLSTLLNGAKNDTENLVKGYVNTTESNITKNPGEFMRNPINSLVGIPTDPSSQMDWLKGIVGEYSKATGVGQNGKVIDYKEALNHLINHPVNTAMDALPLMSLFGGGEMPIKGEQAPVETTLPKVEGNPVMNMLKPGGQISRGGNFRTAVNSLYDKAGVSISGDNLSSSIRAWANEAKLSNLPDAEAIEQAAKTAEEHYAGKTFKPSDLQNIYNNIEKGYTKGGDPRSATASYIDRGIKGVLSEKLNQLTEGNWSKGTTEMAKGYAMQKSPVRKFGGRAASVGLGIAGLDEIRRLIGL